MVKKRSGETVIPSSDEVFLRTLAERQHQLMEHRHRYAIAGVTLERLALESPDLYLTPPLQRNITEALKHVPPALQEPYKQAVDRFFLRKYDVSHFIKELKYKSFYVKSPTEMGKNFFRCMTNQESRGRVTVDGEQGFLTVCIDEYADFVQLTGVNDSVGTYQTTPLYVRGLFLNVPILYIYSKDKKSSVTAIVDHEMQHFFNRAILGSSASPSEENPLTEIDPPKKYHNEREQTIAALFRAIKDEVLCFVREDEKLKEIVKDIKSPTYHPLFTNFEPALQEQARRLTKAVLKKLSTIPLWRQGREGRALLVHLLYPIPFKDIPRWIPVIRAYYERMGPIHF